ncbi:unnamed protein product [Prorocentrum cordatum]|uniref:DUF7869 domain-containing protein n=1 Tax=Prorocentrum cordatum TaxID=2364126 RepID=A0ABN9SKK3_9DINO|nr:unnamed protein product [Polarella glacialis]
MVAEQARDASVRHSVLLRLGEHYDFQAAQRIAISNIFEQSMKDPTKLIAVSWDKMDQLKTIVPRVQALSHTSFQKQGARIVVALFGVHAPCLWKRPLFYTVFKDREQGSDMVVGILWDVLLEAARSQGVLPRRFFIQADNTAKETKNTIVLGAAVWVLAQLQYTCLTSIEFGFLIVGHTHDIVDAIFAYVGAALRGRDILSVPQMFTALEAHMKNPPMWKHLRDVFAFRDEQPSFLSSDTVKGVASPHHIRLFWSTDGSISVQSKKWMTSLDWSDPFVIADPSQVRELQGTWPSLTHPEWSESDVSSGLEWLRKLRALLEAGGPCKYKLGRTGEWGASSGGGASLRDRWRAPIGAMLV